MKEESKRQLWSWLLLVILAIIWGSSFILMKRGKFDPVDESVIFSGEQVAAIRMALAFVVMLPFAIYFRKHFFGKHWKALLIVGLFGNTIPAFLFTAAQTNDNSSFIGMLNSLTPLFTLLLGVAVFKIKIKTLNVVGVLIALAGALGLIFASAKGSVGGATFTEALLVVGATLCYAISVNTIKRHLNGLNPLLITSIGFSYVGPPIIVYLLTTDVQGPLLEHPQGWSALGYIAILSVVGTALAVVLFNRLVTISTSIFAASVTYLIPIVAIFWGLIDGEPIALMAILCSVVILGGVYLVNKH